MENDDVVTGNGDFEKDDLEKIMREELWSKFDYQPPPKAERDRRFHQKENGYDIQNLWETSQETLRRLALGQTAPQISEALGISKVTISNIRNSTLGKEKLEAFRHAMDSETLDIGLRIQQFAPRALQLLEDVIDGEFEGASIALRAKYASQHLGKAGYGEIKRIASIRTTLTKADIEQIKERALIGAKEVGIIDVEREIGEES